MTRGEAEFRHLINPLGHKMTWVEDALCGEYVRRGVDLWFPPDEEHRDSYGNRRGRESTKAHRERESKAKKVCGECPVNKLCLEFYVADAPLRVDALGVYAGYSQRELASFRRRLRRTQKGITK